MNEAVFKTTVMGGFNKSDVLAFIDKQDAQFKEREKDLCDRINKLSGDLEQEAGKNKQLEAKIKELEEELSKQQGKNAEEAKRSNEVVLESESLKNELSRTKSQNDAEINHLRRQVAELTQSAHNANDETEQAKRHANECEEKLKLIDKTEDQIGRALLEAQQAADKIVNSAKEEAAKITDRANGEADAEIKNARARVRELFRASREKLDVLLSGIEDYKKSIDETRGDVRGFFASVDSIFAAMKETACETAEKFSKAFETDDENEAETAAETEKEKAQAPESEAGETACKTVKFDFSSKEEQQ